MCLFLVLILWCRTTLASLFDRFEHLLNDFGVQAWTAVEWHRYPATAVALDAMAALGAQQFECQPRTKHALLREPSTEGA